MAKKAKPKLAVWKFSSCDGCQLTLLDCEEELLQIVGELEIANFMEASRRVLPGPYDLSLVEGSIATEHDRQRIQEVRAQSKVLITIGACATAGGVQALRNAADVDAFSKQVYPHPEWISALKTSTPIADHVAVDFELRGCPISKKQLLDTIVAFLRKNKPVVRLSSVCTECKAKGNPCLSVAQGIACMGPVTQAGCEALCPTYGRGCFGCFGLKENANPKSLGNWWTEELGWGVSDVAKKMELFAPSLQNKIERE